jgi:hypothetical protein
MLISTVSCALTMLTAVVDQLWIRSRIFPDEICGLHSWVSSTTAHLSAVFCLYARIMLPACLS